MFKIAAYASERLSRTFPVLIAAGRDTSIAADTSLRSEVKSHLLHFPYLPTSIRLARLSKKDVD